MTINAVAKSIVVRPSTDGKRYATHPAGDKPIVVASMVMRGAGQVVSNGGTLTGVAPLGVHISMLDSVSPNWADSTEAWSKAACHIDFGYGGAGVPSKASVGTYTHSGESRATHIGKASTLHCFETPGTYTVRGKISDGVNSGQAEITVVVQNPDAVFSGANTVCLHMGGGASGGPAGCTYTDVSSGSWPTILPNRRYLLNRGNDFSARGALLVSGSAGGSIIRFGAYGSGAKPIVASMAINNVGIPTSSAWATEDIAVADIFSTGAVTTGVQIRDVTFLRCESDHQFSMTNPILYHYGLANSTEKLRFKWNQGIRLYDCSVILTQPDATAGSICANMGATAYCGIIGGEYAPNHLSSATTSSPSEIPIRLFNGHDVFIGHVYCHNARETKSHLKIHSSGENCISGPFEGEFNELVSSSGTFTSSVNGETPGIATRWLNVHAPKTSSGVSGELTVWSIAIAPQNNGSNTMEVIRDVVILNPNVRALPASGTKLAMMIYGKRVTIQGGAYSESIALGASYYSQFASYGHSPSGPYYSDLTTPEYTITNGSHSAVAAFADPGAPAGAPS